MEYVGFPSRQQNVTKFSEKCYFLPMREAMVCFISMGSGTALSKIVGNV